MSPVARPASGQVDCRSVRYVFGTRPHCDGRGGAPGLLRGGAGYSAAVISDPTELWLLRHGQSLGNVARDRARDEQVETLDIAERDMDVPLSDLGVRQAKAFGRWLGAQEHQPEVVLASPYLLSLIHI